MNEYRQNVPRQPDRNMIDPTRIDSLVGDLRDVKLIDAPGLPTDYGDIPTIGAPRAARRRVTIARIGLGAIGVVGLLVVVLIYGAMRAFVR